MNNDIKAFFFKEPVENYYLGHQLSEIYKDGIYYQFMPQHKQGTVCVDIGGNIGMTTYFFSRFFEKVYTVEPSLEHFEVLSHMVRYNNLDNVHLFKNAIHLEEGEGQLVHNKNKTMYSLHMAVQDGSSPSEKVSVITLEKLFKDNNIQHCNLLKVDIEGSEIELFSSPSFTNVADKIDTIITERHAWSGRQANQLDEALKEAGFKVGGIPTSADIVVATK